MCVAVHGSDLLLTKGPQFIQNETRAYELFMEETELKGVDKY